MTKNTNYLIVLLAAAAMVVSGCHTTQVYSQGATNAIPQYSERQWFTVAGLVPLSDPAGRECQSGISSVESEMSGLDILINVGLSVAGSLYGASMCDESNAANYNSCVSTFSTLAPFLVSSRTVNYTCVGSPRASLPGDTLGLGDGAYGLTSSAAGQ